MTQHIIEVPNLRHFGDFCHDGVISQLIQLGQVPPCSGRFRDHLHLQQ